MQAIEYEDKYLEDVKDLLVELEEYIVSIDKDHLDQVLPEYREKMLVEIENLYHYPSFEELYKKFKKLTLDTFSQVFLKTNKYDIINIEVVIL